jgi:hypothetical protein
MPVGLITNIDMMGYELTPPSVTSIEESAHLLRRSKEE